MRTATCLGVTLLLMIGVVSSPLPGAQPAAAQAAAPSFPVDGIAAAPYRLTIPEPSFAAQPSRPRPDEDDAPEDEAADEVRVREEDDDDDEGEDEGERRVNRNVVVVYNQDDGRLRVRGRVKLVRDRGTRVEPVNGALAFSSCTDCQTFAVALEIVLISPNATHVAPQNEARAINYQCTRCVTVARAMQVVYTVEDPNQVPDNVRRLLRDMEKELKDIGKDKSIRPAEANARVNGVIAQFRDLAESMRDQLDETTETTSPGAAAPAPAPVASPAAQPPGPDSPTAPFATPTATPATSDAATQVPATSEASAPADAAPADTAPTPTATPTPTG